MQILSIWGENSLAAFYLCAALAELPGRSNKRHGGIWVTVLATDQRQLFALNYSAAVEKQMKRQNKCIWWAKHLQHNVESYSAPAFTILALLPFTKKNKTVKRFISNATTGLKTTLPSKREKLSTLLIKTQKGEYC